MTEASGATTTPAADSPGRLAGARRIGGAIIVVAALVIGLLLLNRWPSARDSRSGPPPSSPVVGVVVGVDAGGLGRVRTFSLRSGTAIYALTVGPLENETEFTPSHLSEHMATSEPIRAYFRLEDGVAVVYRLEDASATPSPE
ncbi:MAG TPA: hypothetical protein VNL94_00455 [Candidatus Binatia bacterium]|nr:hypothetical protein [Candidatus Binatia bacterium]